MPVVFITGGARSGKSSFALSKASKLPGKKAFIATAEPLDKEMRARIERHKKGRSKMWDTYEEPQDIAGLLKRLSSAYGVILIDCLTLHLSNIMHKKTEATIKKLITGIGDARKAGLKLFIVSNEVGMGIVPENEMARRFRDMAGLLNQKIASIADEVYLMVAGIPIKIKG